MSESSHGAPRRRRANSQGGRAKVYKVSATPEEVGLLTRLATEQGVSVQRLMIEAVVANERGQTSTEQREIVAEMFRAVRLLASVANNVNQIARATNATGQASADLEATLVATRRIAARVEETIEGTRLS